MYNMYIQKWTILLIIIINDNSIKIYKQVHFDD